MKKLTLATSAMVMFLSISTYASFSGNWTGRGHVKDISGATLDCQTIQIKIEQSPQSLKISDGQITCNPHELKVADLILQVQKDNLILDGKKVGTLTDDSIRLAYVNNEGIRVRSRGQIKDSKLQYQEEWLDEDGNRVILFQGLMNQSSR